MKKIKLYSPGISSLNVGDEIIVDSIKKEMNFLFDDSLCIELSTHTPLSRFYMKAIGEVDYSFVCGSNLLMGNMNNLLFRQWDIRPSIYKFINPCILIGVGWWQYNNDMNLYTKLLYKKILSNKYLHSVRDSYTEKKLKDAGIKNVINTGCATMWSLTKEHCSKIPQEKANKVIFTLTDYRPDELNDNILIKILKKNYDEVFYWVQGSGDLDYIKKLKEFDKTIKIISPSLRKYDEVLEKYEIDYIGTRLHGGIRALQKQRRTVIIGVDNRAEEKKKDFNLPVISRNNIEKLDNIINSNIVTDININLENIEKFKNQFK
jgi:Uncharacterized conserved protein